MTKQKGLDSFDLTSSEIRKYIDDNNVIISSNCFMKSQEKMRIISICMFLNQTHCFEFMAQTLIKPVVD